MTRRTLEELVSDTLHERAMRDVPYDLNLWPRISGRVDNSRTHRSKPGLLFGRPNLAVVAYMVVLVTAVAVAFSITPNLKGNEGQANRGITESRTPEAATVATTGTQDTSSQAIFTPVPTLTPDATATRYAQDYAAERRANSIHYPHLSRDDFGKRMDLRQTVEGYTIVVKWAYADGNVVLVNLSIEPPPQSAALNTHYAASSSTLKVSNGPTIRGSPTFYNQVDDYTLEFNSTGLLDAYGSQTLDFQLTMMLGSSERSTNTEPVRKRDIAGPFDFNFSLPFTPVRMAEVNQTVSASGIDITLQSIRVSPAVVNTILRVETEEPLQELDSWHMVTAFEVSSNTPLEDWEQRLLQIKRTRSAFRRSDGTWGAGVGDNLYEGSGEWTLRIDKFEDSSQTQTIEGPWVFRFEVPQASK